MISLEAKIPPLLLAVVLAALAWAITKALPEFTFEIPGRINLSLALATCGAVVFVLGILSFRRAGTTVNPLKPDQASSLVTSGIYRMTRNPMYLGFLGILVGWALYLANIVVLILVPIGFVACMNRFQIAAEERALTALFGGEYVAYARRVRRWL
jgi:protein-S-isoprenylcysteine O-methyltransferase Ste14